MIKGVALALISACPAWALGAQTVLELYTAQGCSSCPPADALLGELAKRPDTLALAFHVDYWDGDGWRDRFEMTQATERQNIYVRNLKLSTAFTPQLVMNGRASFVGSDQPRILAALATPADAAPLPVSLSTGDGQLNIDIPQGTAPSELDINLVAYLAEASTVVRHGENSGHTLAEFNIVRQLRRLGTWSGAQRSLRVPLKDLAHDATNAAVFLQQSHQGAILGSASVSLR